MNTPSNPSNPPALITDMKARMWDIIIAVNWQQLARKYFGKPSTWIYQRFEGIDDEGNVAGFTPEETQQFKDALKDLARRINECADRL
jgi:hypothetical protein